MRPLLPNVEMRAKHARTWTTVKMTMARFEAARAAWSSTACVKASVTPVEHALLNWRLCKKH